MNNLLKQSWSTQDIKAWFNQYSRKQTQKKLKLGQSWYPWHVFWHENKEAIDTEAARLCAKATETGDTRLNGGGRSHFDFQQQVISTMIKKLMKKQLGEL